MALLKRESICACRARQMADSESARPTGKTCRPRWIDHWHRSGLDRCCNSVPIHRSGRRMKMTSSMGAVRIHLPRHEKFAGGINDDETVFICQFVPAAHRVGGPFRESMPADDQRGGRRRVIAGRRVQRVCAQTRGRDPPVVLSPRWKTGHNARRRRPRKTRFEAVDDLCNRFNYFHMDIVTRHSAFFHLKRQSRRMMDGAACF